MSEAMQPPSSKRVSIVRGVVVLAAAAAWAWRASIDAAVADAYAAALRSPVFRHDSFEPILSTVFLHLWILLFYAVDHWMPCSRRPASELATWKAGGRLWGWRPAAQYLLPLLAFDALRPRRHLRLPPHPPTAAQLAGDVVGCLLLYDAIFFVAHLALHKGGRWLYRLHARHHAHVPVRASETVRLSAAEVFIDAGISVAVVNITGAHPLSRAVYNVTITYLLSELHCGRDFAFMPHNVVPFGLMGGPPAHAEHHASGRHNFAKFFTHCDKLFGLFRPAAQREHRKRM